MALEVLFSLTTLGVITALVAVGAASYVGTRLALGRSATDDQQPSQRQ
ncbi:hypothetical protein G6M89_04745 [Natronolimnobius sp. AArcel1]|nr:hypothetical protein [Natronolimnobius sp. AArcel1]NGM68323.1 hypothetical protein [Natronolimnobius sp. AArcel1]